MSAACDSKDVQSEAGAAGAGATGMTNEITGVDVVFGLAWGDEAKGKITADLAKSGRHTIVCRWAGGNNAGHTIFKNGQKYKTHLIPSGVFYGILSIVGPGCVINKEGFIEELQYLRERDFDVSLIKVSPLAHVVSDEHIAEDKAKYHATQGTTAKGIAPAYRDKYGRTGKRAGDDPFFKEYLWDGKLYGRILCEGAQGFWLDIDYGNYPYVTSSTTLPYGCCSLGFGPQLIEHIYGAVKIYDTRSGTDPDFPETLMDDPNLAKIGEVGGEYGVTTGRKRKVNWLNVDKLVQAIQISGTTHVIVSKNDVLEEVGVFKYFYDGDLKTCVDLKTMQAEITDILQTQCGRFLRRVIYSGDRESVPELSIMTEEGTEGV